MKTIFLISSLLILSLISFSQTQYFQPNLYTTYLLDSLEIPYLPMNMRVNGEGFTEKYKARFWNCFGTDLRFLPYNISTDVPFAEFISDVEMVDESDLLYVELLSAFDIIVVGSSFVPINSDIYDSIVIVETYHKGANNFNSYSVLAFYVTPGGKWDYISENIDGIPENHRDNLYK